MQGVNYLSGMGYSIMPAEYGNMGASMNNYTTGVGGQFTVGGNVGAGSDQTGPMTLLLVLGGVVVFYIATRKIQGTK